MLKNILFTTAFVSTAIAFSGQFKIKDSNIFSPKELGLVSLTHDDSGFYVIHNGTRRSVKNHCVDKDLRNRPSHKIEKFLEHGYISVNKMSDGEFSLRAKIRGNGGGAVLGTYLYAITKATCYGTLGGIAITGAVAGAVTVAPVIGTAIATGTVASTVGGAVTGLAAGAGAIQGIAAATTVPTIVTAGIGALGVASGGTAPLVGAGVSSMVAAGPAVAVGIEAVSLGAAAFGTWLWFLP